MRHKEIRNNTTQKKANFWGVVNNVIAESDILLLVLDSRMVNETRHPEIERKIKNKGKKIIYVLNKCDLVSKEILDKAKKDFENCVFMSAVKHYGTNLLRAEIMKINKGKHATVGVLGYPNVGKSSIINALAGRGSAPVGNRPGYTKGLQKIRVSLKIAMLDTPGVLPDLEGNDVKHILIGSLDPHKAKDPELAAEILLEKQRDRVFDWYGVEINEDEDGYEIIEKIAVKLNCLIRGGKPDIRRTAINVIMDWQRGKIQ